MHKIRVMTNVNSRPRQRDNIQSDIATTRHKTDRTVRLLVIIGIL